MEPYDAEFRGEVLAACDTNEERRLIALRFNVSESWVRRIQQQRRETGQVAARDKLSTLIQKRMVAVNTGASPSEMITDAPTSVRSSADPSSWVSITSATAAIASPVAIT